MIISGLGSAIPDTAPALAIELADMDNVNPGGSGFPENIYRRWLELDPEAGLENLLKAGPDDDAIKAIGRETSCQDPLTLARLAMRCPALLDDEGFQLQVLVPVIEAVASNDEAGLAEEPELKGFLKAAEMVVHPEALVENWSADSGAFGQLDPERLARLSLAVGPDNFRAMVNGMPTMALRQKIVSMALERFSGFPEQLLMFHRSIEDADLASQSKEQFREAIEAWSPSLADQLMNPRDHSP